MKRAIIAIACVTGLVAGCSSDPDARAITAPPTIKAGHLTACTDMPYEPFEFQVGDESKGIDIDLIKAVGQSMNLAVEFRDVDFDSIFAELSSRKCDLVASAVSITDERQADFAFSDGYFEVNQSLLVRTADKARYRDLQSLRASKVGVQKGTTGAAYVASHLPPANVAEFDDASEMVGALQRQEIEAVVQDLPINSYRAAQSPELAVARTFTDVERERYGFAMNKDAEQLRSAVNASLEQLRSNGEYDKILVRYLGSAADPG